MKACKQCKAMVEGGTCPICKGTNLTSNFKGRVYILDPQNSEIAKKMDIKIPGEYAVKVN